MRQLNPSLDALIPVLQQRILVELLVRADGKPLYRGEIARRLEVSSSTLQRPLAALVRTHILITIRHGREILFEPNPGNPFLPELRRIILKTRGLVDVVRAALEPLRSRIRVAFIFGSIASGTQRADSDVDLLVIGDATLWDLTGPLAGAESILGREVNAIARSQDDILTRLRDRNRFLLAILEKPRLPVVSTEDDLAEIIGRESGGDPPGKPEGSRRPERDSRVKPARRRG